MSIASGVECISSIRLMASSRNDYVKKRAYRFQKLRARLLALYFVPGMVFLLAAIVAIVMGAPTWLQLVVFGIAFALLSAGETKYRCPVCKRTPPEISTRSLAAIAGPFCVGEVISRTALTHLPVSLVLHPDTMPAYVF